MLLTSCEVLGDISLDKILEKYGMQDSKKGQQPMRHEIVLSKEMSDNSYKSYLVP